MSSGLKPIPGFDGYFASESGDIFKGNECLTKCHHRLRKKSGGGFSGYLTCWVNGRHVKIHRLIAVTFVDNPENKRWVNHKDGNKSNNHFSNLEWVTPRENSAHAIATGLLIGSTKNVDHVMKESKRSIAKRGERNPRSKVSDFDVFLLVGWYQSGEFLIRDIAKAFNISKRTVHAIGSGRARG